MWVLSINMGTVNKASYQIKLQALTNAPASLVRLQYDCVQACDEQTNNLTEWNTS